jgi:cation diffusion facilitator family transporter
MIRFYRACETRIMRNTERAAQNIALISLLASAGLAAAKILVGLAANSVAVVSDGIESSTDCLTSGLVLAGLWIASKPPDRDHPYGHGRFETLAGLALGVILAVVGTLICLQSLAARNEPHATASFAIWPLIASISIKGALASAKFRIGRRTGSTSIRADASHDLTDIFSSGVALIGVALAITQHNMTAADHYGGFAVGVIVIFVGLRVARETTMQLVDTMPDPAQMQEIRTAAMIVPGARGVEKCFARKTGLRYHVDLHLEVDPEMSVRDSHEIARAVKNAIKAHVRWVEDVLVHVEPFGVLDSEPAATIKR